MPGASPRALANTLIHPLARMLPQLRYQLQVYRLGEKQPPSGSMVGHAPHWAITQLLLDPLASQQVRMNLQPDFHWLATVASSMIEVPTAVTFTVTRIVFANSDPVTQPNQNFIEVQVTPPFPAGPPFPPDIQVGQHVQLSGLTTWPALNGQIFTFGGVEMVDFGTGEQQWVFFQSIPDSGVSALQPIPTSVIWNSGQGSSAPETGTLSFLESTRGNFRAQIFDTRKSLRMADRGVRVANLGGDTHGVHWLRDPYRFDQPDSQVLLIVQNLANQQNEIQIALYGQVLRFNQQPGTN